MNAVKTLMLRSLDYAGVFPPAQLPMNEAIKEFAACRNDPNEWLLARFVLPAARIGEFAQCAAAEMAEAGQTHNPWHLTGLFRSAASIGDALSILRSDAQLLRKFVDSHPNALVVDSCELPLPEELLGTHDQELARGFLDAALQVFDEFNLRGPLFWEVNLNKPFAHFAHAAHQANLSQSGRVCLKYRTGGLTPAAIVSPEALARAFRTASEERIPFKLTAGLHLPMRHFDASVGADLFGFLNVFAAAALSWKHKLSETELTLLLSEKDPQSIIFAADGLSWKGYHAGISDIRSMRSEGLRSFGSCSFYEPIEELKSLQLLS